MHDIVEQIAHHPCYVMGDFNLDLLKHELHRSTERCLDTMYVNSYIPMINRPTRVTRNTCSLIDNIFTNNYRIDSQLLSGILKADISDHYVFSSTLSKALIVEKTTTVTTKLSELSMNLESMDLLKQKNTDWSVLNSHRDC